MKRALVIGAQGVLGTFVARALSAAGWEVIRAGRRPEEGSDFRLLDLDDSAALADALGEADLAVNTAHHPELGPELSALRNGATLIDLAELTAEERASLANSSVDASGLVVADAGLSGVAYLAIADLLRENPTADRASYALMFSASGSSGRAGASLGHAVLTESRHHPTLGIRLPKPWGRVRPMEICVGAAIGSLPEAIGGVPLRHYLSMQPRTLQTTLLALNATRTISLLPAAMFTAGTGKVPSELSDEPICERVAVFKDGRELATKTIEGLGYYRMTAASILAFAHGLTQSPPKLRGLRSIDEVLELGAIKSTLDDHLISVNAQPAQ